MESSNGSPVLQRTPLRTAIVAPTEAAVVILIKGLSELLARDLFAHEREAFTSALERRLGLLAVDGGR